MQRNPQHARRRPTVQCNSSGPARPVAAQSLTALIAAAAQQWPDAVAVVHQDSVLTYRQLTDQASRLAGRLRHGGVVREATVGVCVTRGPALVVAVLAVLEAGGAYVPLDPALPVARLATMLAQAQPAVCVVDEATRGLLPMGSSHIMATDETLDGDVLPAASPHTGSGGDLAYVIFTSGSTGRPKGICVEQRSVVDFVVNNIVEYRIEPGSRMLGLASIGFDVSVAEIFTALVAGATLVIADDEDRHSPARLQALLSAERITAAELPPSLLGLLDPAALPDLRLVSVGGESPGASSVAAWVRAGKRVINAYGPTETTVTATLMECTGEPTDSVPIGRPMANHHAYVLDRQGEQVAEGTAGELWIAGPGVARGYLHEPELTADRFRVNPFDPLAGRMYGTGDRVRWNTAGTLDFLGRVDGQLNVRGARVEPGEVESRLRAHPAVVDAAVTITGAGSAARLGAAVLLLDPAFQVRELARWCGLTLPPAAVPSWFQVVRELPRTVSGKVDRVALQRLVAFEGDRPVPVPARNDREGRILAIWQELFPPAGPIGVHDDFFEIGGHSLLSMRMLVRLRTEFGVDLSLGVIARAGTVAALAVEIAAATVGDRPEAEPKLTARGLEVSPLSFAQQRLWFIDRFAPDMATYHLPVCLRLRGPVDPDRLGDAIAATAARHQVLRTAFVATGDSPVAVVADVPADPLHRLDLSDLAPTDREDRLRQVIHTDINTPFVLAVAPLWRARLVSMDRDDWALILVVHHGIADGWSLHLFLDEVARHYVHHPARPVQMAAVPGLPGLPYQYGDFAAWQRERLSGSRLTAELDHWRRALDGAPGVVELPSDRVRPVIQSFTGARVSSAIEAELARSLLHLAERHRVTPFVALLAVFHTLVGRLSGSDDVVVACPVVGRPDRALESLIGFFVDTVPVRVVLSKADTFAALLERTGAAVLAALSHSALPFDLIVQAVAPPRDASRNPLVQVAFNLLDYPPEQLRLPGVQVDEIPVEPPGSLFDVTMYARQSADRIELDLVYNSDLYDADRMQEMLSQYLHLVRQVVNGVPVAELSLATNMSPQPPVAPPAPSEAVIRRFLGWVEQTPTAPAITAHDGVLSYRELDRVTNALCGRLFEAGVRAGTVVGIAAARSAGLPVAVLAARKLGAVVALVDASLPPRRQIELLEIASPAVWIALDHPAASPAVADHLRHNGIRHLTLPRSADVVDDQAVTHPMAQIVEQPTDPAFLLFTSGTTGTPLGVLVPAGALAHFVDWYAAQFGLTSGDRFVMTSGVAHDPVLRDMLVPLSLGAHLSIPSPVVHRAPDLLLGYLVDNRVSVLHLTPQLGRVLYRSIQDATGSRTTAVPTLRLVACGGDVLLGRDVAGLATLAPAAELVSFYGTTETPQAVAWQSMAGQDHRYRVPIGSAIADTEVVVVTAAGGPAGVGEPGEIVVRSNQLAIGYLQQAARTADRFGIDPTGRFEKFYRTGDLGRYLADGRVEIFGRIDQQVKVRGFRVEVAEVVGALLGQSDVAEAAVTPIREVDGEVRMIGYVVPAGRAVDIGDLLARLRTVLPEPAVPSAIISLPAIPLTANGKLDIAALPRPGGREASPARFREARDPADRTIVDIWCRVLGLTTVGIDDNFFDVGGTSLRLVEVQVRLQEAFDCALSIVDLFQCPTVRSLARLLTRNDHAAPDTSGTGRRADIRRSRRVARSLASPGSRERPAIAQAAR